MWICKKTCKLKLIASDEESREVEAVLVICPLADEVPPSNQAINELEVVFEDSSKGLLKFRSKTLTKPLRY